MQVILNENMFFEYLFILIFLLALGIIGGFLAGLLRIGGGAIFVPGLYYILRSLKYELNAMHIAVGTSLLIIVVTGASSAIAHYKKGAVDVNLFKKFLPGIVIGVVVGAMLASIVSALVLKFIFATSQMGFGTYMLLSNRKTIFNNLPKQPLFTLISSINACLSTLMGVGGGVQNITFMTICNVSIHNAIATAAAIGPIIATIGATGFLVIGWNDTNVPPLSLGYLNIMAFSIIALISIFCAPMGAKLAHRLPTRRLKRYFGIFMIFVATKMLSDIFIL
ncbi:MAG: sulfite exporter TauE/SafE family protein [Rickettsiales bacterium]|nr:sulfite exporter TauE/SafE family protein [Rickettsiales bacterium]